MLVTINTDASFSRQYKRGAYAFSIVCNHGRFQLAGMLRKQMTHPQAAEFMCIINAIYYLHTLPIPPVTKIIVNTDCLDVIHLVQNDKAKIKRYGLASWGTSLVSRYEHNLIKCKYLKMPIEFRHVKAHETTSTRRTYVNERCDQMAKEKLRKALNLQPYKK